MSKPVMTIQVEIPALDSPYHDIVKSNIMEALAGFDAKEVSFMDALAAARADERERVKRHMLLVGADWRDSGADLKWYATEYLVRAIDRDLTGDGK